MKKRQFQTNDTEDLSQEETQGLSITQGQILDAYNAGTSDESAFYLKTGESNLPAEHTDEDS